MHNSAFFSKKMYVFTKYLKHFTEEWKRRVFSQRPAWFGLKLTITGSLFPWLKPNWVLGLKYLPSSILNIFSYMCFAAYGKIQLAFQSWNHVWSLQS